MPWREEGLLFSVLTLYFLISSQNRNQREKPYSYLSVFVAAAQAGVCRRPIPRDRGVQVLQAVAAASSRMCLWRNTWTWECLCEPKPSSGALWGLSVSSADIKSASPHQSSVAVDFLLRQTRENRFSVRVVYFNMFQVFDRFLFFFFFFLEASLRGMTCFSRKWE